MKYVTLDPRVIAPPSSNASADSFRRYVADLIWWLEIARQPSLSINMSERGVECLQEDGLLPIPREIEQSMRARGVEEYDFNTIRKAVDAFYNLNLSLEVLCGCREVLYDGCSTEPSLSGGGARSREEAARSLVLLGFSSAYCGDISERAHFCSPNCCASGGFRVRATVMDADSTRPEISNHASFPVNLDAAVAGCSNPENFLLGLEPKEMLSVANSEAAAVFAFRVAFYINRRKLKLRSEWTDDLPCTFHPQFWKRALDFTGSKQFCASLIAAMLEVVTRSNPRNGHPIRTSTSGNSVDLVISGHKAMRHDVSEEHHVHYWDVGASRAEFSWLSFPHKDMHIENPLTPPRQPQPD